MLYCEWCNEYISDTMLDHALENHRMRLLEWLYEHIYETDGYDAREEALTVGERNPTLK